MLWVTVGEEKDKMTGFGLDLRHVSIGILQVVLTALSVSMTCGKMSNISALKYSK